VSENPYQAPAATCELVEHRELLPSLRCQSTWALLGLGMITLGVYYGHYCLRQTRVINRHAGRDLIPPAVAIIALVGQYASLGLFVGYFFVDEHHPIAIASNAADKLSMLPIMVWGFYGRSALNRLLALGEKNPHRLSGLWTFLFSPLHFNYRVNQLNQAPAPAAAVA
jgi:hypothetical protein